MIKNVTDSMLKTAIFIELEKFEILVEELTNGEHTVYVEFGDVSIDDIVLDKLKDYFNVNIASIHADCYDIVGIWIIYTQ